MSSLLHLGLGRRAIASSCIALLLGNPALAQVPPGQMVPGQAVRVFDDAPSIEQLRSIMIPESQPGGGRTIVIQRPDTAAPSTTAQRVATQALPAPRSPVAAATPTPVAAAGLASPPAETVAASVAAPPMPAKPAQASNPAARPDAEARTSTAATAATEAKANTEARSGTVGFRINFGFDSAVLPEQAHAMIDRVAELMKEAPAIKVRVEGHTDAIGSADYNVALSERRAVSVAEYLVKRGINPARLVLVGKGMADPLTRNPYDPNNRRVQFVRIG
jgi:outer membrane protein OmpA-like peptidoglycan-associated protein